MNHLFGNAILLLLTSCFVKSYHAALATFSRALVYFSLTAVDVFAASMEIEAISESGDHIIGRRQLNPCYHSPDLCSLPAGGK